MALSAALVSYASLPVRGAWIEMSNAYRFFLSFRSLPVRGAWIEIVVIVYIVLNVLSLPVRGAWIEISYIAVKGAIQYWSLPVRGAWIEIARRPRSSRAPRRRSPCGERGLK